MSGNSNANNKGEAVPDLDHFYRELADINIALSSERNLGRLGHIVLLAAKRFCNADAAIFLDRGEGEELLYGIVQVDSLKVRYSRRGEEDLGMPGIPLNRPKSAIMALSPPVKAALEGVTVNTADVHEAPNLDSSTCAKFDKRFGYVTKSLLAVSIRDSRDQVLAVLQLANAKDPVKTTTTMPTMVRTYISTSLIFFSAAHNQVKNRNSYSIVSVGVAALH